MDPSPSAPFHLLIKQSAADSVFDRKPHLFVNYAVKIYEAGHAFMARGAVHVS